MHLNKILDQIKHHPSPTEAIDKLGKALEKHEGRKCGVDFLEKVCLY